ncbi:MAG: hypothetical protein ABMA13_05510 [Chthoniobacteraceae bacterium]
MAAQAILITSILQFQTALIREVERVLATKAVHPGFQHHSDLVSFETEVSFATGEAIGAFARRAMRRASASELNRQRRIVDKLVAEIVAQVSPEELNRRCLDASIAITLMLEELGIWAVTYLGTLIYDGNGVLPNRSLYYVDDIFNPPENSEARGHSWIFTPGYPVLDLTAHHQPLPDEWRSSVPFPILLKKDGPTSSEPRWYLDLSESPMSVQKKREWLLAQRKYPDWNRVHSHAHFHSNGIILHFVPMDLLFGDSPLKEFKSSLQIGGTTAFDFFNSIRSKLVG